MRYKKWRYKVNEYFTFSLRERNGILVLSFVLIILQVSIWVLHFLPDPDPLKLDAITMKKLAEFEVELRNKTKSEKRLFKSFSNRDTIQKKNKEELFVFNPNTLTEEGWMHLGFSEKQTSAIIKWRERSGKFHNKEEVSKVWVINPEKFKRLESYISIPVSDQRDTISFVPKYTSKKAYEKPIASLVELNSADSTLLSTLPLIGEGRARSIIRYREFLGGFISVNQLSEVRNLPDSVIKLLIPKIKIDLSKVKSLNINLLDANGLRHPYLPKAQANMIVNFRHEHGNFKTIEDLKQLPLFNDDLYRKIAPYLTVNP